MTTLAQVRDALETKLKTLPNLRVYDYVPDDANYPAAIIFPPVIPDYREDLAVGSVRAIFAVLVLVPRSLDRKQLELYPFIERIGTQSIFALIDNDPDLGLGGVSAHAVNVDDFDTSTIGLTQLYGRAVNINVFVS